MTRLDDVAGKVLVAGSHGGVIAAYLGAEAGVHALILNDAGLGKDRAGIAGLVYLEEIGMAAAAVDCMSARIGDGADMLARGVISHANVFAALCGVVAGQSCRDAAERMRRAAPRSGSSALRRRPLAGRRRTAGSLGARLDRQGRTGGRGPDPCHRLARRAARRQAGVRAWRRRGSGRVFNDAGVGADRIGISRLPVLAARGIPAAAVDCMSARIGDGRSMWESGLISHVNAVAARMGVARGMSVQEFATAIATSSR